VAQNFKNDLEFSSAAAAGGAGRGRVAGLGSAQYHEVRPTSWEKVTKSIPPPPSRPSRPPLLCLAASETIIRSSLAASRT
jgi:hypothetical protein